MKKYIIVVLIVMVGISVFTILRKDNNTKVNAPGSSPKTHTTDTSSNDDVVPMNFVATPQTSEHFVSSSPEHANVLKKVPQKVSVTFDLVLMPQSTISVTDRNSGVDVSDGVVTFSGDNKTMEIVLKSDLGNGQYTVLYSACGATSNCEMGSYQFGVKN